MEEIIKFRIIEDCDKLNKINENNAFATCRSQRY